MVGLDCTIIMHPQVWKCSGHFDLFVDKMVDCRESKKRYRYDHVFGRRVQMRVHDPSSAEQVPYDDLGFIFVTTESQGEDAIRETEKRARQFFDKYRKEKVQYSIWGDALGEKIYPLSSIQPPDFTKVLGPDATSLGTLTPPRDFNLMFPTTVGALAGEEGRAFLRPETAQGIFVNFKNVLDSTRVRVPFGIAQMGKSFRNEITPRNFTFRSREFEQMEIEFFCHPNSSRQWYQYWRDRRMKWYTDLGLSRERLQLREHHQDELSHYSTGTADIEYAFPFLPPGEFGELEGIAHRGDFDLRSHMEGKLVARDGQLVVEQGEDGKPKWKGSGKDLSYRDDLTNERFVPHVIEPSAGADRGTLAFLCEAYHEDKAPDEKGEMQVRTVMKFHPRIAPIKVAVFPLVKKDGMPEVAQRIYRALKPHMTAFYDEKGAVGRRYRRQDEAGTPYCLTIDGQSLTDGTVTVRDRDSLKQERIHESELVAALRERIG
jgi:glycyl-tRNA synthetase